MVFCGLDDGGKGSIYLGVRESFREGCVCGVKIERERFSSSWVFRNRVIIRERRILGYVIVN